MSEYNRFRDAAQKARWEKDKHLEWFHKVTSEMTESEVIETCRKRSISPEGQSIHALQTALLQAGPHPDDNSGEHPG